jgi:hypothetical protein
MRFAHITGAVLSLVLINEQADAQNQPATIPTVVAQAMAIEPDVLGRTQYFDGRPPPDWPVSLVPPGARVVGGGVLGDAAMFRLRAAVFAFSGRIDPKDSIHVLLTRAGYVLQEPEPAGGGGGFVTNEPVRSGAKYCKGSTVAGFRVMDSTQVPLVIAIHLIDGEAGRQNCAPDRERMTRGRFPIKVPTLSPPSGVVSLGGGSSWSGSDGNMRSTLRTTLATDSILSHYTTQLVAGGWKSEGKPAIGDGIAVQRFSFGEGRDAWTAALIVAAVGGDRRALMLEFTRND